MSQSTEVESEEFKKYKKTADTRSILRQIDRNFPEILSDLEMLEKEMPTKELGEFVSEQIREMRSARAKIYEAIQNANLVQ